MSKYFVIEVPDAFPIDADGLQARMQNFLSTDGLREQVKVTGGDDSDAKTAFILLQEGGSSDSIYVHAHETEEEAEADRYSCRDDGSYRTTPVIEAPPLLTALGEVFYEFLDSFCRLANDMDYPEGDNPYAEDEEDEQAHN